MHRFFLDVSLEEGQEFQITGDDGKHLSRSLRVKPRELIEVVSQTRAFLSEVIDINRENNIVFARALQEISSNEPSTRIRLFQGITKGKEDVIIQKCTEVGVFEFIPLELSRSVSKIKGKEDKKLERWRKIAKESAMQSKRNIIPFVHNPISLKNIDIYLEDLSIILYEEEDTLSIKDFLRKGQNSNVINIFAGPEGGFSSDEVDYLKDKGANSVSLGRRILRTETSGLVAASLILYEYGDMEI